MPPRKRLMTNGEGAKAPSPSSSKKKKSKDPATLETGVLALRDAATRGLQGIRTITPEELLDSVVGVPLRGNLAFQYLLGVDVVPLHRALFFVGEEGSGKSVLSWWISNLFIQETHRAAVVFLDLEHKTNPEQIRGVIQNDELYNNCVLPAELKSIEDLNQALGFYCGQYLKIWPLQNIPIILLIDSLGAATSDKALAELTGTSDKAVTQTEAMERARTLTGRFRALTAEYLSTVPMCIVAVNHLKVKVDMGGGPKKKSFGPAEMYTPGGSHKDYLSTATIQVKKGACQPGPAGTKHAGIYLTTRKASLAPTGRSIFVVMQTKMSTMPYKNDIPSPLEVETGALQRMQVNFDWDHSLGALLTEEKADKRGFSKAAVEVIIGAYKLEGRKLTNKHLGLDGVTLSEFGAVVNNQPPEVIRMLQDVIGIYRKRIWTPPATK